MAAGPMNGANNSLILSGLLKFAISRDIRECIVDEANQLGCDLLQLKSNPRVDYACSLHAGNIRIKKLGRISNGGRPKVGNSVLSFQAGIF